MGFQNGSIRACQLLDKKDFSRLGPHWTRSVHDQDYGDISSVSFSYDDRYVFSTGLDGNIFVYQTALTARLTFGKPAEPETIPLMVNVSQSTLTLYMYSSAVSDGHHHHHHIFV